MSITSESSNQKSTTTSASQKPKSNPVMNFFMKLPDAAVLMFVIIAIGAACSWFVPAGEYTRVTDTVTGNTLVQAGSYHAVEGHRVGIVEFLASIPAGIQDAAGIVTFIILIGGGLGVVSATGAIDSMIAKILKHWGTKRRSIIFVLTFFFGFCASSFGLCSEGLVFIPIMISLYRKLGYDAVTAVATVMCASATGYGAAPINAFNVGVAQGIAGLPLFSGMAFRWVLWVVMFTVLSLFIYYYAEKIRKDPSKSLVADMDYSEFDLSDDDLDKMSMTPRQAGVLVVFFGAISWLIFASVKGLLGPWSQYSAIFMTMGILAGIVGGMKADKIAEEYIKGCQMLLYAAITVGMARSIGLVLESGKIMDTLVYFLFKPLEAMQGATYIGGIAMVWLQAALNVIMPSNSGQAMATMPILLPLGDLIGLNKQITVLAFQMGDGFTMMLFPTMGIIMAALALAKISFVRWIQFVWKLAAIQMVLAMGAIVIAVAMNYGPF